MRGRPGTAGAVDATRALEATRALRRRADPGRRGDQRRARLSLSGAPAGRVGDNRHREETPHADEESDELPGARSVVGLEGPDGGLRLARSTERQQELYWAGGSRLAALRVGDIVIRSHRLLKTRGTVVRVAVQRRGEARQVWVKWDHPDTFPNPSLESADSLEEVRGTSSPA